LKRLQRVIRGLDPQGQFLKFGGPVEHAALPACYRAADAFVFGSSCENLPNILLEAMASGLPIACSNRLPMPEVLGQAGIYFDPVRPHKIEEALSKLFQDGELRRNLASAAYERAERFSWSACARDTFRFLADVCELRSGNAVPSLPFRPIAALGTETTSPADAAPQRQQSHRVG
jgi:glycosyltransferase involved in cell wall biosynthesis